MSIWISTWSYLKRCCCFFHLVSFISASGKLLIFSDVLESIVTSLAWMPYTHSLESVIITVEECTYNETVLQLLIFQKCIGSFSGMKQFFTTVMLPLQKIYIYSSHPGELDSYWVTSTSFKQALAFFPIVKTTVLHLQISGFKSF